MYRNRVQLRCTIRTSASTSVDENTNERSNLIQWNYDGYKNLEHLLIINQFPPPATYPRSREKTYLGRRSKSHIGKKWKRNPTWPIGEKKRKVDEPDLSRTAFNSIKRSKKRWEERKTGIYKSRLIYRLYLSDREIFFFFFFRPSRGDGFLYNAIYLATKVSSTHFWAGMWNRENFATATGLPLASFLGRPSRKLCQTNGI